MTSSGSLREFLTSRRAALDPQAVGLPVSPVRRRGKGLRREEVAALAGVSVDYYARLEQGRIGHVSDQVLRAIENALQLDDLEREHLRKLVAPEAIAPRRSRPAAATPKVRVSLRALIDAMDPIPVMLQGPRMEILAWNRAAAILLADFGKMRPEDRNVARWLFLDPTTKERYPDWEQIARPTVDALRGAHDPRVPDAALEQLVGELSVASAEFARYWADYRLFKHTHGTKRIFHPTVGTMTLNYETLDIADSGGQFLSTYTAAVGSPSEERLRILMSWGDDPQPPAMRAESLDGEDRAR